MLALSLPDDTRRDEDMGKRLLAIHLASLRAHGCDASEDEVNHGERMTLNHSVAAN